MDKIQKKKSKEKKNTENIFPKQNSLSRLVVYKIRASNESDQQAKNIFKDQNK